MQISKKTIIGVSVLCTLGLLTVLSFNFLGPRKKFVYYRVDGEKFKRIVTNSDFEFLRLKPDKGLLGLGKVKLDSKAEKKGGDDIDTDGLLEEDEKEAILENADFKTYKENYLFNLKGEQQLKDLLAIIDSNAGAYFLFEPVKGDELSDPKVKGVLCYKIHPFKKDGTPIQLESLGNDKESEQFSARSFEFIPRPPGSDY